jgi:hypothetical protein
MNNASLVFILKTVTARAVLLESNLGKPRAARVVCYAVRGCWPIEAVFRNWVDGVAMEHTRDPDTLRSVRILLAIFMAEMKALKTRDYGKLKSFFCSWVSRCIQILETNICIGGDLVFFSPNNHHSA